jgi:cobalt-precorrin-5B (C1)-methyltransferase
MRKPTGELRRGWTTGACATAAVKAALTRLWGGEFPDAVTITLPKGETPTFPLAHVAAGDGWAEVGITKDAGDDPDVTHGALIVVRVAAPHPGGPGGVTFRAGPGVGTVTKPGLPILPGEPAINPVPRAMMAAEVAAAAALFGQSPEIEITVSVPGGEVIAQRTWNPRLGIEGGLSILGTTGIVRPFSCAAWIASIHRGIDVARASGLTHVAGCTGSTSETAVQRLHGLPDHAMLDMGDFAGGMLKYLRRHPVPRLTIGGGIAKMTKLAQGAGDLHSARSQVDFAALALWVGDPRLAEANTVLEAHAIAGAPLAEAIALRARLVAQDMLGGGASVAVDTVVIDRSGEILAQSKM